MQQQQVRFIPIKTVNFWENKDALVLINDRGDTQIVGANLIRHVLGIPYTKKDGTFVSKEQILSMKQKPKKFSKSPQFKSFKPDSF